MERPSKVLKNEAAAKIGALYVTQVRFSGLLETPLCRGLVFQDARREGRALASFFRTVDAVHRRLGAPNPVGFSLAGSLCPVVPLHS